MSGDNVSAQSQSVKGTLTWQGTTKLIFFDWWNLLLVFLPIGIISYLLSWDSGLVFWFNFFALIPLAKLLGFATEELAVHTGEAIGGLLNASFGNAVEMILTIELIQSDQFAVVKQTLIGSILSNLLLVLGWAFAAGGIIFREQKFNAQGANVNTSLLFLSLFGLVVPTAIYSVKPEFKLDPTNENDVNVSRIIAFILLGVYCLFIGFQLKTHQYMFSTETEGNEDEEDDEALLSFNVALILLLGSTALVAINSQCLVAVIKPMTQEWGIPEGFVGIILLPIVGNACEHATAVVMAMKDKVDLSIGIAVGSSTQIALCVVPFAVLMGLALGKPMNLIFGVVETVIVILSVLIVANIVSQGRSVWLSGAMLLACYAIVGAVFWYYVIPDPDEPSAPTFPPQEIIPTYPPIHDSPPALGRAVSI